MFITLTEEEERALKLIALMREGVLEGFQCSDCRLQKQRNCEGAEDFSTPVLFLPDIGQLYVCPVLLIPPTIIQFMDEYDYYEKYPSACPSYKDVNPRFWCAVRFYENYKAKIMEEKIKITQPKSDNLSKMRELVKHKKG